MTKFYNAKYIDRTTVRNYNAFAEEYFCGTDINIEIDGKKIPVAAIDYTLQEQLKPIYGYASRVFDDVAVGVRIVVGSMMIPIRDTANHPEFRNNGKLKENTPDNFNIDYDEELHEKRKLLRNLEFENLAKANIVKEIDIEKNTELFLTPYSKNSFMYVDNKCIGEIIKQNDEVLYVYIKDLDVLAYIKKGG